MVTDGSWSHAGEAASDGSGTGIDTNPIGTFETDAGLYVDPSYTDSFTWVVTVDPTACP